MLRWFVRLQVATACFSYSPPDLTSLDPYFIFMYMHYNHCHRATGNLQLNIYYKYIPPPGPLHLLTDGGGKVAENCSVPRGNNVFSFQQRYPLKNRPWKRSLFLCLRNSCNHVNEVGGLYNL
jgi:hypothetical protein